MILLIIILSLITLLGIKLLINSIKKKELRRYKILELEIQNEIAQNLIRNKRNNEIGAMEVEYKNKIQEITIEHIMNSHFNLINPKKK